MGFLTNRAANGYSFNYVKHKQYFLFHFAGTDWNLEVLHPKWLRNQFRSSLWFK